MDLVAPNTISSALFPGGADVGTFSKHLCTRGRYICVAAEVLGLLQWCKPVPQLMPARVCGGGSHVMAPSSLSLDLAIGAAGSNRNPRPVVCQQKQSSGLRVSSCVCKVNKNQLGNGPRFSCLQAPGNFGSGFESLSQTIFFFPSSRSSILPKTAAGTKQALCALITIATLF